MEDYKGQVLVYSIIGCPHCLRAKNTLQKLGLLYIDVSVDKYEREIREEIFQRVGRKTVPQIYFNEIHIGGNEEFQKLVKDDKKWKEMMELIKTTPAPSSAPTLPDSKYLLEQLASDDDMKFECEPDEYYELMRQIKHSGIVKDHRTGFGGVSVLKNSFTGKDLVDWLINSKDLDKPRAMEIGRELVYQHFGHQVKGGSENEFKYDKQSYYRLIEDDDSKALNAGDTSHCRPRPASDLGEDIRHLILKLYNSHLSSDGRGVDYDGISKSQEFRNYRELTKELHRVELDGTRRNERLAFFINVYNALVIHAKIVRGKPDSLWQRWKFFNTSRYIIGGHQYSMQDIENGILRGNKKGVGMFTLPFGRNDARLHLVVDEGEPLIHFGLNCGSKSCPPIKTYSSQGVMTELKIASEAFLENEDGCSVNMGKKEVALSMIFKWYREDFGKSNDKIVEWVYDHLSPTDDKKPALKELIDGGNYKVVFLPYDWGDNST